MIYVREFPLRYLDYATNGALGRPETDPVYKAVTENRDTPGAWPWQPGYYSSCGDLAHWMYEMLGVRFEWVNRKSLGHYKVGMNVSRLAYNAFSRDPEPDELYNPGDVLIVWQRKDTTDAHVICVNDHSDPQNIITNEYGQPGGAMRVSEYRGVKTGATPPNTPTIRGLPIRRVLILSDILDAAERNKKLVEPTPLTGTS
jgi:hypothetical protein